MLLGWERQGITTQFWWETS